MRLAVARRMMAPMTVPATVCIDPGSPRRDVQAATCAPRPVAMTRPVTIRPAKALRAMTRPCGQTAGCHANQRPTAGTFTELGDASVPFPFDVHMMIWCPDAPALETALHHEFHKHRVNKVNPRKKFFRLELADIKKFVERRQGDVRFTADAEALEYRQSLEMSARGSGRDRLRPHAQRNPETRDLH